MRPSAKCKECVKAWPWLTPPPFILYHGKCMIKVSYRKAQHGSQEEVHVQRSLAELGAFFDGKRAARSIPRSGPCVAWALSLAGNRDRGGRRGSAVVGPKPRGGAL